MTFLKRKNIPAIAVFVFVFTLAITIMLAFSITAYAAEDAAAEAPEVFCEYFTEEGVQVDGNTLTAGTYDVSFNIKGISEASALEITTAYDPAVVKIEGINNSISSMTSMGSVTTDGNLVVGYVSDGDSVAINADSQFIASVKMTFTFDEDADDAEKYLQVSDNPNLTFVVTNSAGNNYDDEYALVESFPDYSGTLSLMTCNVTPDLAADTYNISGQLMIAGDIEGTPSEFYANGITVDVIDKDGNIIATDTTSGNGNYELTGIPTGDYVMSIHGDTTVDRQVALKVNESKNVTNVGIVICDYNHDNQVDGNDLSTFLIPYKAESYSLYYDFNNDFKVDGNDLSTFLLFCNNSVSYSDVTL